MDRNSFMWDGKRYARAMMVTQEGTVWIMALPSGTSTQRAELVALTKALEMVEGRRLNAYMDSRCAFAMVHIH